MSPPSHYPNPSAVVEDARGGASLRVRVRPYSRRREVLEVSGAELVIGVGAPPERGRANVEALRELARWLDLPYGWLALVSGETSRSKRVSVFGYDAAALRSRIAELLSRGPS